MKKSVLVSLIVAGIVIVGIFTGAALVLLGGDDTDNQVSSTTSTVKSTEQDLTQSTSNDDIESAPVEESTSSGCGDKGQPCTTQEVATHNSASDCWVIYDGNYYDVTSYVRDHEGGSAVFNNQTCGKDIQKYLEGTASSAGRQNQHGSSAYRDLEEFLIGPVEN